MELELPNHMRQGVVLWPGRVYTPEYGQHTSSMAFYVGSLSTVTVLEISAGWVPGVDFFEQGKTGVRADVSTHSAFPPGPESQVHSTGCSFLPHANHCYGGYYYELGRQGFEVMIKEGEVALYEWLWKTHEELHSNG